MRTKRCPVCKNTLPTTQFSKNRSTASGLCSICKKCDRMRKHKQVIENHKLSHQLKERCQDLIE